MKQIKNLTAAVIAMLLVTGAVFAQDYEPTYMTVSTWHWNWDNEDGSPERWLELEKMWHENVTEKNEHIAASGVYYHLYTGDNSEVLFVTVYPSWEAIELAGKRNGELAEAAWTEEELEAFNKERNTYFAPQHSDEIYVSTPFSKPMESFPEDPVVMLVVDRHLAFPEDGDNEEFASLVEEFHTNVTHQNPYVKGFYMHRHAWGSDGRDMVLAFALESFDDVDDMQAMQGELIEKHWPDEEERKAFFKKMNKYWTPWHSDRFYENEPELMKEFTMPEPEMDAEAEE